MWVAGSNPARDAPVCNPTAEISDLKSLQCEFESRYTDIWHHLINRAINIDVQEDKNSDASDSGSTPLISIARGCQGFDGA